MSDAIRSQQSWDLVLIGCGNGDADTHLPEGTS